MKHLTAILLLLALLLCGCSQIYLPQGASSSETSAPTAARETLPPETEAVATEATVPETQPLSLPEQLCAEMTLEEKIGQLFLARCPDSDAASEVERYHLGGYILFGRDFADTSKADVIANIESYQAAAEIPLLIAVDEEGGTVNRVSWYTEFRDEPFHSPRYLYQQGGLDAILENEAEKCSLLKELGINVNMAPVCDISTDPDAFMYDRSLGEDPSTTATFAAKVVEEMNGFQMGSVLKHFPGYGNNDDTHIGIAVDGRSLEELESRDLIPFHAGMDAGCGAVLVTHTIVECLDSAYPASLSPAVHQYIRDEMGYHGVIITDDLAMDAITDLYGDGEAAVLAILAGNDLLCSTYYQSQYSAVLEAVQDGTIPMERIDEAVLRVLEWKDTLGLWEQPERFT